MAGVWHRRARDHCRRSEYATSKQRRSKYATGELLRNISERLTKSGERTGAELLRELNKAFPRKKKKRSLPYVFVSAMVSAYPPTVSLVFFLQSLLEQTEIISLLSAPHSREFRTTVKRCMPKRPSPAWVHIKCTVLVFFSQTSQAEVHQA